MSSQSIAKALTIRELPRSERPRERLKHLGAQSLGAAELIAIVLGTGTGRKSSLDLAHAIMASAGGSLRRLAAQPVAAVTALEGVGAARATAIHAALELGRRAAC